MIKRIIVSLFILLILSTALFAQNRFLQKKAPIKLDNKPTTNIKHTNNFTSATAAPSATNYVVVDTMANSFGPASASLNPLAYDANANVAAVVHRGYSSYAKGSGELWYNISTDKGATWSRVSNGINSSTDLSARYPSMAISNPTGGDLSQTIAVFSWPQLNSTPDFAYIGYGADQPVGGGVPFAEIDVDTPQHGSTVPSFVSDNSNWVFWASNNLEAFNANENNAEIELWRTQDFATIENIKPVQWGADVFQYNGNISMGGVSNNGVLYYGVIGSFLPPDINNPIVSGWFPGYSKSTDNGVTWSDFDVIDFRNIPALSAFDRLWDYIKGDDFISYQGDINVDKNGYVHIITGVTDTTTDYNTGRNAIVEIFETASGWDGKIIADNLSDGSFTTFPGPALGQMGPCAYIATNKNKDVFAAQWVAGSPTAGDSLCDVYFSFRDMGGEWSTPQNLTQSDNKNENSAHFAPTLADGSGTNQYVAFSFYNYEAGYNGYDIIDTNPSLIYIAPVPFTIIPSDVSDNVSTPNSFELSQNYPNPFNPSTLIKYSISERSNVSLRVYDMLGREVATLVNELEDANAYQVNFNASNLASGLYVYKFQAGNFTAMKKMMLLK